MASNERDDRTVNGAAPEPMREPEGRCAAEDLRHVLRHIADQISDADRRHSSALRELIDRLAVLGEKTEQAGAHVPAGPAPAFDRVEDGMEQLAHRLTGPERDWRVESADPTETDATAEPASQSSPGAGACAAADRAIETDPSPAQERAYSATALQTTAPAPLKSAVASSGQTFRSRADDQAAIGRAPKPDPFDFAEYSMLQDPMQPWDKEQADALAHIYHQDAAPGLAPAPVDAPAMPATPVSSAAQLPPAEQQPVASVAAPVSEPSEAELAEPGAAAPAAWNEADRDWLDRKFADIAARVEQSLLEMRPEGSLAEIQSLFDVLESRLADALEDVATRADVDGLRIVEAHIRELAAHVAEAQASMARLDGIEAQLAELVDRISGEGVAQLLSGARTSAGEVDQVADALVERVMARLPQIASHARTDGDGTDDIRLAIGDLAREQRTSGEQTASMLETMQQAMIRLLDRMDALENAQLPAPAASLAEAPPVAFGRRHPAAEPEPPAPTFQRRASDATPAHIDHDFITAPGTMTRAPTEPVPDEPALPRTARATQPLPAEEAVVTVGEAQQPSSGPARPIMRNREEFVAAARRAMHQTASRPVEQPHMAADTSVADEEEPAPAKPARTAARGKADAAAQSKMMKPALLVAAIALIALGGAYTMLRSMRAPERPAITVERQQPTESGVRASPTKAAPEIEDEKPGSGAPSATDPAKRAERGATPTAPAPSVQPAPAPSPRPKAGKGAEGAAVDPSNAKGLDETAPGSDPQEATPRTLAEALKGITVHQTEQAPSIEELIRTRHNQGLAALSGRVGAAQPTASVSQVALIGSAPEQAGTAPVTSAAAPAVELPPATIGPLSLRLAAGKGDPSAEFEVGARFAEGKGVQQDFKQALAWYQRAASQGFAPAQYRLATLIERGLGTKADIGRAKVWYARAAEQGNVKAMHNLAVLAAGRETATPDYATAARWFKAAAERGLADSQFNLGVLYENGLGVALDLKQAYRWLSLAARDGDPEAARRKDAIFARFGAEEKRAATELLESWKAMAVDIVVNDAKAAGEAWKARRLPQQQG
jgi:localization factor PodJL